MPNMQSYTHVSAMFLYVYLNIYLIYIDLYLYVRTRLSILAYTYINSLRICASMCIYVLNIKSSFHMTSSFLKHDNHHSKTRCSNANVK